MTNPDNPRYGRLTALLLAAWLAGSITASAVLIFHAGSKYAIAPPVPLGLAVILPIALFLLCFTASHGFRQFALSLNPVALTIVQTWRIGGVTFLVLAAHGLLPAVFALPAGLRDFAFGLTRTFARPTFLTAVPTTGVIAWSSQGMTVRLLTGFSAR